MRVLVCGGRDYENRAQLFTVMDFYHIEAGSFEYLIHAYPVNAHKR